MIITWQDMLERADNPLGRDSTILKYPKEAKKTFDYYYTKFFEKWDKFPRKIQLRKMAALISSTLNEHKGKFVLPELTGRTRTVDLTFKELVKKDPSFAKGFENYLKNATNSEVVAMAKKNISLKDKFDRLSSPRRKNARESVKFFKAKEGRILLRDFSSFTNFKFSTLRDFIWMGKQDIPKTITAQNAGRVGKITRGKEFLNFLKNNDIELFQETLSRGRKHTTSGNIYVSDPTAAQRTALSGFLNLVKAPSLVERRVVERLSRNHPIYKDSSTNLKMALKVAKNNLNTTIRGYSDKGLKEFLKEHPKVLKNATMWFNRDTGKINYTPLSDIYKKDFNMDRLRKHLRFEIEHNRSVNDYWKNLSRDGKISAKNALLNDAEFAHNLSIDTSRYNRGAKEAIRGWIESPANAHRTTEIANLEKELANLGHRFYAGGEWRGRALDFKPGYKDTVLGSWREALEKSTGLKWKDQLKNIYPRTLETAMKDVSLNPNALRQLGTFLGCPGKFKS